MISIEACDTHTTYKDCRILLAFLFNVKVDIWCIVLVVSRVICPYISKAIILLLIVSFLLMVDLHTKLSLQQWFRIAHPPYGCNLLPHKKIKLPWMHTGNQISLIAGFIVTGEYYIQDSTMLLLFRQCGNSWYDLMQYRSCMTNTRVRGLFLG